MAKSQTTANGTAECAADCAWAFSLPVDPATIGTAQQKQFDPRTRRFFTPKRVAAGMRVIAMLARAESRKVGSRVPPWNVPVSLSLDFFYAVPKSRRRKDPGRMPREGEPCTARWAGDCDNRAKAVVDALTDAGLWPDDQFVTSLHAAKRWTLATPRIEVAVRIDRGMVAVESAETAPGAAVPRLNVGDGRTPAPDGKTRHRAGYAPLAGFAECASEDAE